MNICFFGSYNPTYSRNKILIDGLNKNNVTVFQCRSTQGSILKRYPELIHQFWAVKAKVDVIYVAFVGHLDMPLAWLLARLTGKKVVFDMFYSMFDTYVFDRRSATPNSIRGKTFWWIDKIAATLGDLVITDTKTHGNYFIQNFKLNAKKFKRVFVGGDDTEFKKLPAKLHKKIVIEFHGMFTRLHGAEYFVEAAKAMENFKDVEFWLIGSTSNYPLPIELYKKLKPKNLRYWPELKLTALTKKIAAATISVGHIGGTVKARSVITNKMFHAINCGLVVVAGDCSASRELFTDKKDALFVTMGESTDLVKKLTLLIKNKALRKKLARNGYGLSQNLTNEAVAQQLITHIATAFNW